MSDLGKYSKQQLLDELSLRECPAGEIIEDILAVARYIDQQWNDGQSGLKDLCVTQLKEFASRLRKVKYDKTSQSCLADVVWTVNYDYPPSIYLSSKKPKL